jgi:hypothetical protein
MLQQPLYLLSLLLVFSPLAHATRLTYKLDPHAKACFYSWVDRRGTNINFDFSVQSGGAFDIDYQVLSPEKAVVLEGTKEKQGDFIFPANSVGEYSFCLSNEMSTLAEKMVEFDISVENEQRATVPAKKGTTEEQTSALEESLTKLAGQLATFSRTQKYFRTRENRNFSTVRSTESRIFSFSVIESIMMVSMACLQVFVVRIFFVGARKALV